MRSITIFALVLFASQRTFAGEIDFLGAYVGTWSAETKIGSETLTSEINFEWALNKKFLRTTNVVKYGSATVRSEGMIGWNGQKSCISSWSFIDDGGHLYCTAPGVPSGDTIVFEGEAIGGGAPGWYRYTFTKKGDKAFVNKIEAKRDGNWKEIAEIEYKKK